MAAAPRIAWELESGDDSVGYPVDVVIGSQPHCDRRFKITGRVDATASMLTGFESDPRRSTKVMSRRAFSVSVRSLCPVKQAKKFACWLRDWSYGTEGGNG